MEENDIVEETHAPAERVGDTLRLAREKAGLEVAQVAAETRIPHRHLLSIEAGEFSQLPSRTYAIGFSRTYARTLGLDDKEIVDRVRYELDEHRGQGPSAPTRFEPGDPARVPGRGLAWFALLAAVILLGGIYAFYRSYFAPGLGPAPLQDESEQVAANDAAPARPAASATPAAATGPVVFTSEMDDTWVKFYDKDGTRLFEAQMAKGDTFTVPADAEGPQIWTGRPYALSITVGGKPVPKLSEEDEIVKDVPVTPQALVSRQAATAPAPSAAAASTPTPAPPGG